MKQTIEIEVPEGKKAIWKDNNIVFEDIGPQLPKTWEEFCSQNSVKTANVILMFKVMYLNQAGKIEIYMKIKICFQVKRQLNNILLLCNFIS